MFAFFLTVLNSTKGIHKEFEREAIPHSDILYNYALRMTGNADDARDLLQETFLKAYRFWDKYEKGTNVRAWLFRIMKNTYINVYRKAVKEPDTVDYNDIQNFYNVIRETSADPNDLQEKLFGNRRVCRMPGRDGPVPPASGEKTFVCEAI